MDPNSIVRNPSFRLCSLNPLSLFSLFSSVSAQAGKRGLAWPYYNSHSVRPKASYYHIELTFVLSDPGVFNNGDGEVVAIYDWETYAPVSSNGNGGLGFIGMQADMVSTSSPVEDLATRQAEQGWATVFSLNEPDISGTITPAAAADWYIQWINPLAIKKALPAVTSSTNAGQGLSWLSEMISACAGECFFDYINLHWYGTSFAEFQSYILEAHSQFPNYNMVITEFALNAGGDQLSFFQSAFPFLDGLSYVILYFPFVATSPALLTQNDDAAVVAVGTDSCLYTDAGGPSAVGNLMY
ncbi:hypothetical protein BT96DRAFT_191271 [Gymnopus androsaceus JB14]|uniref:Asl1-like glycosyl hydrolase catalytic domain-containing protein n=1 Tax=Gymnopus androsaceus JB14 TaxID=1447944 RepID=A0A6A4IDP0_9AGAR|nr:hypothetical protein BT96DRAFT_191271 [Gymnopus androsaceus JB14]